ncbi:uncharacterized protein CANTADRAFT_24381 [Suhomyces tanzawaensis NRRL Y-17324]|uniref:Uncharacterized protein n=1 Tax=Suhomyces tanzawaensis NRRL Y-17324 TaxID=984487 RepID=A0A1E4SPI1_9ASCO|nr:uncharacterized protein CANTADRAFT_24381 [Suhomyces tanzawaensis NRRL Y-17324]ODV81434.1 hypothetical protein CANTADRAFT_24381 [Suhomyces tanzawaensis NRRL Y-17324]
MFRSALMSIVLVLWLYVKVAEGNPILGEVYELVNGGYDNSHGVAKGGGLVTFGSGKLEARDDGYDHITGPIKEHIQTHRGISKRKRVLFFSFGVTLIAAGLYVMYVSLGMGNDTKTTVTY